MNNRQHLPRGGRNNIKPAGDSQMETVEVRSRVSLEELLNGVAQLDTPELERFVSQVLTIRARRIAPSLPETEANGAPVVYRPGG